MKLDLADSKKSRTMVRISNLVLTLLASTRVCHSSQQKQEKAEYVKMVCT